MDLVGERVIIGRDLGPRSSVGGGYAFAAGFLDGGGTLREHRLIQQYAWRGASIGGTVSLRSRLEQRFIEGNDGVMWRMRQQVRVSWPLTGTGRLQLVAADEVFVYANTTSRAARGFDGNRVFAGLRQVVTPRAALEAGYLNAFARVRAGGFRRSHVLSAVVGLSF